VKASSWQAHDLTCLHLMLFDIGEAHTAPRISNSWTKHMKFQAAYLHRHRHHSRAQEAPNALNSKRSNTPWSDVRVSFLRKKIQVFFLSSGYSRHCVVSHAWLTFVIVSSHLCTTKLVINQQFAQLTSSQAGSRTLLAGSHY
jgi:hypothetical protein